MNLIYKLISRITGKNLKSTPIDVILDQLSEPRALPMGRKEFDEWSERIISGAACPADHLSQKFALAEMIMHIKPTDSHVADGYFIKSLRKGAANQVAFAVMQEIRDERKAALAAAEAKAKEEKLEGATKQDLGVM